MVVLIVVFMIVAFITADVLVRLFTQRMREKKLKEQREEALDIGLRLDYAEEAPSLKRVEVEEPSARILAVDDEPVVLDSFRKILVIAGYSVDTVETGKEAVGIVQKNDYDFVFTDLKMPDMDGLDVTKAVKHLRPDIDVIMITGYATIESAVDAMKYGALDYVQKPFTEDELVDFVNKSLIRRQAKLERQLRPKVRLVTPSKGESTSEHVFNVPSGAFFSKEHAWATLEVNGMVSIGLDDFLVKLTGEIEEIMLPEEGQSVKKGENLFSIKKGERRLAIASPFSGKVISVNSAILDRLELLKMKPYELGWVCCLEPDNLSEDLKSLRIGTSAVSWYQEEIEKYWTIFNNIENKKRHTEPAKKNGDNESDQQKSMEDELWKTLSESSMH